MLTLFKIIATGASCALAAVNSEISTHTILLGSTNINITKEVFQPPAGCSNCVPALGFLNLHENENTSVVSVRSFLQINGGSLTKFAKGHTRTVTFSLSSGGKSSTYTFDPNRMFTPEGIKSTLNDYSKYSEEAAVEVEKLADAVLEIYDFDHQDIVLALHNNGGTYGANSYLPGGSYANDAEKVNIVPGTNPSDFYYVVDPYYYDTLATAGYNVVLQNNETVTNDGSLSYYAGIQGKSYVNFESLAECTDIGRQVVIQLDMVIAVKESLRNTKRIQ